MKNRRTLAGFFLPALLMLLTVFSGTALAYDVSGTVAYSGTRTGRIYVTLTPAYGGSEGYGTSLAAPSSFTIHGVPDGEYVLRAFRDTVGNGVRHASDPNGSVPVTVQGGNLTGADVTMSVSDPEYVTPEAPTGLTVLPGSGGAFVAWEGARTGDELPVAQYYNLYWKADPLVSPTNYTGSKLNIPARDFNMFIHSTTTTSDLYYVVTAKDGTNVSAPSEVFGPVSIGALEGNYSVSGTVNFPAQAVARTLDVAVVQDDGGIYVLSKTVTAGSTSTSFNITGVPNGTYQVYAILDLNANGLLDVGDLSVTDAAAPNVTVNNANVSGVNVAIQNLNAEASVSTSHWKSSCRDNYGLEFSVKSIKKQPVTVALTGGPGITSPVDVGLTSRDGFRARLDAPVAPKVGDVYTLDVTYADGTSGNLTATVTAVLDSFPIPIGPAGFVTGDGNTTPTFSWSAPAQAPAGGYSYSLWLSGDGASWEAYDLSSNTLSVPYTGPTLTPSMTYTWYLSIRDVNDNTATIEVPFRPVDTIPEPSVTGFDPQNGKPGTTVSIWGSDFSPYAIDDQVLFNGIPATSVCYDYGQLKAVVPLLATDGPITVSTTGGSSTSGSSFTVIPPIPPTISGFTPTNGPVGTPVTITGTGFYPTPTANTVKFGDTAATVVDATDTELVTAVPAGAVTGKISITTAEGTGVSADNFTVIASGPPNLEVSPTPVDFGDIQLGSEATRLVTVTNNGTGFLNVNSADFTGSISQFMVESAGPTPCPELPAVLPPGYSCTLQASFAPTSIGEKSATLTLASNDPDTPSLNITFTGTGVGASSGLILTPSQDGLKVTLSATLTSGSGSLVAGKTVYFYEGTVLKAFGITAGNGTVIRTFTSTQGSHDFTAVFKGDPSYAPVNAGPQTVVIGKVPLASPATGAVVTDPTPTLSWQAYTDATGYRIQAATAATFATTAILLDESVTATSYEPTNPLPKGKVVFWRVIADIPTGKTIPSDSRTLIYRDATTLALATPVQDGLKVTLTAALSDASGNPMAGKTVYFYDGSVVKGSGLTSANGTITKAITVSLGSHSFTARFKGTATSAPSESDPQNVEIGKVLLDAPVAGAIVTDSTPTFSWDSYTGATSYHIQVATASTFAPASLLFDTEVAGTSHTATVPLIKGKVYYWRVYAVVPTGKSVPADFRKVTYKAATQLALELDSLNATTVKVRATLVDPVTGTPIPGKSLAFFENTSAGAFVAKGTALTGSLTSAAPGVAVKSWATGTGSHQAYVKFAGDTLYAPADTSAAPLQYTVGVE